MFPYCCVPELSVMLPSQEWEEEGVSIGNNDGPQTALMYLLRMQTVDGKEQIKGRHYLHPQVMQ